MNERILIVDDEASIARLLKYNIEKAGYLTEVAYNGKEAIEKAESNTYDLIILDLMLPCISGMEVCRHLRANDIETPILMLTARGEEADKIRGLESGADDYLTKPFSPKEVIARIRAILRRMKRTETKRFIEVQVGGLTIFPERHEAELNGEILIFTRKEFELLLHLAESKGKVLTREELLLAVWNYDFVGDTRIVDVHISHLRDKIEENTRKPTYIKTVRGLGYKIEEPII